MYRCRKCNGEGYEYVDEGSCVVKEACYHCGTTGQVDEETDWHDRLGSVAMALAYQQESEYRKWCDSDPDGDGYDLHAAENMMRTSDYFMARVYDRHYDLAEKLVAMDLPSQKLLVAWEELPHEHLSVRFNRSVQQELETKQQDLKDATSVFGDDDIPF